MGHQSTPSTCSTKLAHPCLSAFIPSFILSLEMFYLNGREKTKSLRWCFWCKTSLWNTCSTPTSPMSRRCYVRHKGGHFLSVSCPPIGCIDPNRYKKSLFPLLCGRSRSAWAMVLFPWGAEQECVPMQMRRQEEEFRRGCEPSACCSAALLQSTQRLSCQHETLKQRLKYSVAPPEISAAASRCQQASPSW